MISWFGLSAGLQNPLTRLPQNLDEGRATAKDVDVMPL